MKFFAAASLLLVAAVSASELDARAACNANNCARAVTGTRAGKTPDAAARMTDCSSFQLATVYTCAGYGTPIATSQPTAVPTYASDCTTPSNPQSAYASACSCWGITPTTTTTLTVQYGAFGR